MIGILLVILPMLVIGLLGVGIAAEKRQQTVNELGHDFKNGLVNFGKALGYVRLHHPNPALATLETLLWMLMFVPLLDHVLNPQNGITAVWVWYLTIGPHELGHVICIPFGRFLAVAGGSIWQVLFWAGIGTYTLFVYRRLGRALIMWVIAGHSFVNLSVYIRDASTRNLDLLFGLDKDAHDWWNLLRWMGLLEYDAIFADAAVMVGFLLVLITLAVGILSAWFLPRTGGMRFQGFLWSALANSISQAGRAAEENTVYGEVIQ